MYIIVDMRKENISAIILQLTTKACSTLAGRHQSKTGLYSQKKKSITVQTCNFLTLRAVWDAHCFCSTVKKKKR